MVEFNGKQYSGSAVKNDDEELIIVIFTSDTLDDVCLSLAGVQSVTVTDINGNSTNISVRNATQVTASAKNCYTVIFTKKLSVIEELSEAIDALLVMALEK